MIGDKVRERRTELGLTQEGLASMMGYKSKSTINKIEMNIADVPLSKVKAFAQCLHTTPAYLMGWSDSEGKEILSYYIDSEADELAQELVDRPELKVLFNASRDLSKEDIQFVVDMIERMK